MVHAYASGGPDRDCDRERAISRFAIDLEVFDFLPVAHGRFSRCADMLFAEKGPC